jgi:hypothetical protein
MCAHSSSGAVITEKIGQKLYPFISSIFQEIIQINQQNVLVDQDAPIAQKFYQLKSEFDSLRNYEVKLVFPSVLRVFNTKDKPEENPSINLLELQRLTQNKEKAIMDLVATLKCELSALHLAKEHPLHQLIYVFETSFVQEKQQWNSMLNGWNLGCACFAAAQNANTLSKQ